MTSLKVLEKKFLDDLFEMNGGYVLNFSDKTMREFFANDLNIEIDAEVYREDGTSKAKRLRCLLRKVDDATAVRVLEALWDYRRDYRTSLGGSDPILNAEGRFLDLIGRLKGKPSKPSLMMVVKAGPDAVGSDKLRSDLIALAQLEPQPRGYAFEKFLRDLFNAHGLEARDAFRLTGEQIDGSFQHEHFTYLLEAKWQSLPVGADDLHVFQGKLAQKAAWARGLFISNSGFTAEGLVAFGRAKQIICMDGLDLWDLLHRQLPLGTVVARKARLAAETGSCFMRVRDLFPGR